MAMLTVRNLPEEVHRALRARAASHGHSMEAEARAILSAVVRPEPRLRVGDALAAIGQKAGLTDEDLAALETARSPDRAPAEPFRFA